MYHVVLHYKKKTVVSDHLIRKSSTSMTKKSQETCFVLISNSHKKFFLPILRQKSTPFTNLLIVKCTLLQYFVMLSIHSNPPGGRSPHLICHSNRHCLGVLREYNVGKLSVRVQSGVQARSKCVLSKKSQVFSTAVVSVFIFCERKLHFVKMSFF